MDPVFTSRHFVPGLSPQCVKEPPDRAQPSTRQPQWPRSVITPHGMVFHAIQGQLDLFIEFISSREFVVVKFTIAFKLIKLPTKYSLNFKASC